MSPSFGSFWSGGQNYICRGAQASSTDSVQGKSGRTLKGCLDQIRHQRVICIKEIWGGWVLAVMSSKDFKMAFIVIEKFKFSQGSLKNAALQFSDSFCLISQSNLDGFGLTMRHLDRLGKHFKMMYGKPKSIAIWQRYRRKIILAFHIFETLNPSSNFASSNPFQTRRVQWWRRRSRGGQISSSTALDVTNVGGGTRPATLSQPIFRAVRRRWRLRPWHSQGARRSRSGGEF